MGALLKATANWRFDRIWVAAEAIRTEPVSGHYPCFRGIYREISQRNADTAVLKSISAPAFNAIANNSLNDLTGKYFYVSGNSNSEQVILNADEVLIGTARSIQVIGGY